jgi:hypothetical protein
MLRELIAAHLTGGVGWASEYTARFRALADVLEAEENEWAQHAEVRCELYGERCHRPGHNCASFSPDRPHVARCTDFNVSEGPE